jgi:hypothetical protein
MSEIEVKVRRLAPIITELSCLTRQILCKFANLGWGEINPPSLGKKAAAARSTGLRPIHFSNRGNGRGSQLPANYYKIVMSSK